MTEKDHSLAITRKRGGGRLLAHEHEKLKRAITQLILTGDKHLKNKTEWSQEFNVSLDTFNRICTEVYNSLPPENINEIYRDIKGTFERIKYRLTILWAKAEAAEQVQAEVAIMREIRETIKDFTKMLEDFHIKPKSIDFVANKKDDLDPEWLASLNEIDVQEDGK